MDTLLLAALALFYVFATLGYVWATTDKLGRKKALSPSRPAAAPQQPFSLLGVAAAEPSQSPAVEAIEEEKPAKSQSVRRGFFASLRKSEAKATDVPAVPNPPKQMPPPKREKPKGRRKGFQLWGKKGSAKGSAKKEGGAKQKVATPQEHQTTQQEPAGPLAGGQERVLVDSYSVYDPFVRIVISLEPDGSNRYIVVEPELSKVERAQLKQLRQALKDGLTLDASRFKPEDAPAYLEGKTKELVKKFGLKIPADSYAKLFYFVERDFLRYGKLDPLMRDPNIEDISCNGPESPIFVFHRTFESIPTNIAFRTQEALERYILRLAYMSGKHISVAEPVVDAALPEGSRIQMTFGSEITKKGSTFTIRKFKEDPYSIVDLIRFGTIDADIASTMWYALENKGSILLSGGTASGKTTTINCLAVFIRPEAKIVTIEDTPEINLVHSNWIESVSRQGTSGMGEVTLYDLLRAALRQRPDFIIVGEVRGEEANTMFQALSTGHSGMSSIHADSIQAVFNRLTNPPMSIPRNLIPSINFVLQQNRLTINQKPSRRIVSVTEVVGMDARTSEIITNEAYRYNPEGDAYLFTGRSYIMEKFAKSKGITVDEVRQEIATRKAVIQWMVKQNVRKYSEVARTVQRYYTDKSELLAEMGAMAV